MLKSSKKSNRDPKISRASHHKCCRSKRQIYRNRQKRKNHISGRWTLFQKGYAETSISDIARKTKMSKEIFYLYFRNKDELFIECADRIFRDMYNHVWMHIHEETDMRKRLWKRMDAFIDSYPRWVVMMNMVKGLSVSENPLFKKQFLQLLRQIINPIIREVERLRQEGRIYRDLDSKVAGYVLGGMIEYGADLIHKKMYTRKR